jgi:predicted deacylase
MAIAENDAQCFSATYTEARSRFRAAARAAGATLHTYDLKHDAADTLRIDVAVRGAAHAPALLLSSGIHGVEGFFGSAVQLALLQRLAGTDTRGNLRYVLIHALNPYGFAHLRRANEDNVDLNRNFLSGDEAYAGAPAGYADLDRFLNPSSPPPRFDAFRLQAAWHIARGGLPTLRQCIAGGQYAYPRGLFYGGDGPCASTRIVQQHCDEWLAAAQRILHIDLHTGLGAFAQATLLPDEARYAQHAAWYARTFGAFDVEAPAQPQATAYRASGTFGGWMQQHFAARDYRFMTAEFGTCDAVRVLAALRAENRAHHFCAAHDPASVRAKQALRECFCPASPVWRNRVLDAALNIVDEGARALW